MFPFLFYPTQTPNPKEREGGGEKRKGREIYKRRGSGGRKERGERGKGGKGGKGRTQTMDSDCLREREHKTKRKEKD